MWGKNQDNQKPIAKNMYKDDEITKSNDLNALIDSYDVNKITEEQYDKMRYLNNLNKELNQDKESDNEDNNNNNNNKENHIPIRSNIHIKKNKSN